MGRIIKGKIFSGLGSGAFFTQLDWVKQQCWDKLGFLPFPGTLNFKVREHLRVVKKLREAEGIVLVPPTAEFCQAKCLPVTIGLIRAAIIIPQAEHFTNQIHPQDVIEIVAPVNIKERLSVEDGDELTLEVDEQ